MRTTAAASARSAPWDTDAATFGTSGWHTLPLTAPNFRRYDEGLSDFNHSRVLETFCAWQTPSLSRMNQFARQTIGSWRFSGILIADSGAPLALYTATDLSLTRIGKDRPTLVPCINPYLKGSCATNSTRSCLHWLNPAAFTVPATGTFGDVGTAQFIGPGYWDWDMGVFKGFPIRERYSLQFRGELFNAFNHTNFMENDTGSPSQNLVHSLTGSGSGKLLLANDPHIIQLALKVVF